MEIRKVLTKNATFQRFEVLKTNRHKRYAYGAFLVEGVRNINEALACGFRAQAWLYAGGRPLSRWAQETMAQSGAGEAYALAPALMDELSGKTDTSELLGIFAMREDRMAPDALSENPLLLLFDRPSNKGNLGTVLRSCDALGAEGVVLTGHGVDLYAPEVLAASMGSFFRVPAVRVAAHSELEALFSALRARYPGFRVIGTTAHADEAAPLRGMDLSGPALLMIGNETDGLSRALKAMCDALTTIPMREGSGASSLNVACAATVLLYEAAAQRGRGASG